MGDKKRRKKPRHDDDGGRRDAAEMTTGPFRPESPADPSDGTAAISPVSPEMMDHAAHAAAEMADAAAHDARDASIGASDLPDVAPVVAASMADAATPIAPIADDIDPRGSDAPDVGPARIVADGPKRAAAPDRRRIGSGTTAHGPADALSRCNDKVLDIIGANMAAAGSLMSALLEAKSLPEAAAINAEHLRRQFDAMTMQGRELLLLAQSVVFEALRPARDSRDASRDG